MAGHRAMEMLASARFVAGDYGDYDHVAVAPAGLLALALAVLGIVFTIARTQERGHRSDAAIAARAVLRFGIARGAALVLALQLATLYAGETFEHFAAFHAPGEGFEWLGGPLLPALAVHALLAFAATVALRRSLGSVLRTCDALFRAVATFIAFALQPLKGTAFQSIERRAPACSAANILAFGRGLRAPPGPAALSIS